MILFFLFKLLGNEPKSSLDEDSFFLLALLEMSTEKKLIGLVFLVTRVKPDGWDDDSLLDEFPEVFRCLFIGRGFVAG